jgi:hypothetical protein
MKQRRFETGDVIFTEGEDSGEAYLIHSGRVEIVKSSAGGGLCLAVLGAGDVLGAMGLLDDLPRSATARALEPVLTSAVDSEEFLHLILEEPEEALELLRALFERLRTMNQKLAESTVAAAGPSILPRVTLYPLTPEAEQAVPAGGMAVTRFPFRVGRKPDNREEVTLAFNDVELQDREPYRVSLNHFAIDLGGAGLVVRDRGSRRGTTVNGARIGAREGRDHAALRDGDNEVLVGAVPTGVGPAQSRFCFRIAIETD